MRPGLVLASTFLVMGCSADGSCDAIASCAKANTVWSRAACDCVPVRAAQADFWQNFSADYDWVEHHPTLKDAIASSDAALLGKLASVAAGVVIQGDAVDDVYTEVDITVEVLEPLHGDALTTQSLQLTLPPTRRVTDELLASMNSSLPSSPVFLILRKRMSGKYRVVNGFGLWAETKRGTLDAPLLAEGDLDFVAAETAGHRTAEQLAKSLQ